MDRTSRRTHTAVATRRTQIAKNRLLIVVDASSSSKRAVNYVAKVLASRRGFQVCLAYFLSPLPPTLLEFGGAEDPDKERQMSSQLKIEQWQCIAAARAKSEPALNRARTRLQKAGLPASSLTTQFSDPLREQNSASEEIFELARINKCRTIVVGRRSLPWLRRFTAGKDLAEKLVQRGKGVTLWVVE